MQRSSERILTSHVGSLPRPEKLIALNSQRATGTDTDEAGYQQELRNAVVDLVARQKDCGIDLINDGEFGHSMGHDYDYGPWWTYIFQRLSGLELVEQALWMLPQTRETPAPGEVVLAKFSERRDWEQFHDAYMDPHSGAALPDVGLGAGWLLCCGAISWQGQGGVARDIPNLKGGLEATGIEEGWMSSVAPASFARFG